MKTPSHIRKRSWQTLLSARLLMERDDVDNAAYLAGWSVELLLKARYCSKMGLKELPNDWQSLKKHKLADHNLDNLLTLCEGEAIQRDSLDSIDWASLSSWDNQDRYQPFGTTNPETAVRRMEQADLLFKAFVHYEIVEALEKAEAALAAEGVVFNLLAWVRWPNQQWQLNVASKWLDDEVTRDARVIHFANKVNEFLAPDLQRQILQTEYDGVDGKVPRAFYNMSGSTIGTTRGGTFYGGGGYRPSIRNPLTFAVDNIHSDGVHIDRAYVVVLMPPARQ